MTAQTPAALQVMAYGYIAAWLAEDYWTVARIAAQIEDSGVPPLAVAEAVTLAAAALLTDALGGLSLAAETVAARRFGRAAARQARAITAAGEFTGSSLDFNALFAGGGGLAVA